jgi:hypothetical protein
MPSRCRSWPLTELVSAISTFLSSERHGRTPRRQEGRRTGASLPKCPLSTTNHRPSVTTSSTSVTYLRAARRCGRVSERRPCGCPSLTVPLRSLLSERSLFRRDRASRYRHPCEPNPAAAQGFLGDPGGWGRVKDRAGHLSQVEGCMRPAWQLHSVICNSSESSTQRRSVLASGERVIRNPLEE